MRKQFEPQPGALCTPEELHWMQGDGYFYELEEGVLVQYPSSIYSSMVRGHVIGALFSYVGSRKDAWILSLGVGFQCFPWLPTTVRRPSVSYLPWNRISLEDAAKEEHCKIAPDLVAEVLIGGDLPGGIHRRVADWLEAGVRLVWVVNPLTRSVLAHFRDGPMIPNCVADTLTCEELLPGFACPVAALFETPR